MAKKAKKKAPARRPARKAASKSSGGNGGFSMKNQFLDSFQKEHATTMKVIRAYPPNQGEFRPHPRSHCARELAFTFQLEQTLMSLALTNQLKLGGGFPKAPMDFQSIIAQFDKDYHGLVDLIKKTSEKELATGTVVFPTGPGKLADWPKIQFLWFLLSDQIHHRGQYAVYTRMAGGKVPSIYGPSADEPWT